MNAYKEVKSKIDTGLSVKSKSKRLDLTPNLKKKASLTDRPSTQTLKIRPPPGGTDSIIQKTS